ncbi:uncharacterized protein LOC127002050 isoform X2 [Eriocheir sinensis]|nr:uncharacterized protein LOC127002050 isoform X2 [Eriocheir sinensis]
MGSSSASSLVLVTIVVMALVAVVLALPASEGGEPAGEPATFKGNNKCRDNPKSETSFQNIQREEDCLPNQDYIKELFICKNRTQTG